MKAKEVKTRRFGLDIANGIRQFQRGKASRRLPVKRSIICRFTSGMRIIRHRVNWRKLLGLEGGYRRLLSVTAGLLLLLRKYLRHVCTKSLFVPFGGIPSFIFLPHGIYLMDNQSTPRYAGVLCYVMSLANPHHFFFLFFPAALPAPETGAACPKSFMC